MPQRPETRDQLFLLPPSLDELVGPAHPVRYVAEFVESLTATDWATMKIDLISQRLGAPCYSPKLLLGVWLSGFVLGMRSSRALERGCQERFDLYWIAGGQHPDHNTLWRFYADHRNQMRQLLRATIRTAVDIGLIELAIQAVDGTKVLANANPDAGLNRAELAVLATQTERAITELETANQNDAPSRADLPVELQDARVLHQRIAAVRTIELTDDQPTSINRTDPEAARMKTRQGIGPAYNAQVVVTPTDPVVGQGAGRIILAAEVTTQSNDVGLLRPMIETAQLADYPVPTTLADAGYSSQDSLLAAQDAGFTVVAPLQRHTQQHAPWAKEQFVFDATTDTYHCPHGQTLKQRGRGRTNGKPVIRYQADGLVCQSCPAFGPCTRSPHGRQIKIREHETRIRQHAQWMQTEPIKALNRQRKGLIEPVFGILKEQINARRTLLRGRAKVEAEWVLTATAYNLRTLARAIAGGAVTIPRTWG